MVVDDHPIGCPGSRRWWNPTTDLCSSRRPRPAPRHSCAPTSRMWPWEKWSYPTGTAWRAWRRLETHLAGVARRRPHHARRRPGRDSHSRGGTGRLPAQGLRSRGPAGRHPLRRGWRPRPGPGASAAVHHGGGLRPSSPTPSVARIPAEPGDPRGCSYRACPPRRSRQTSWRRGRCETVSRRCSEAGVTSREGGSRCVRRAGSAGGGPTDAEGCAARQGVRWGEGVPDLESGYDRYAKARARRNPSRSSRSIRPMAPGWLRASKRSAGRGGEPQGAAGHADAPAAAASRNSECNGGGQGPFR